MVIYRLGVLTLLFIMNWAARLYRKAGPHEALIVYGSATRGGSRSGNDGVAFDRNCHDLSLELMSFDVAAATGLYTKQGVA